MLPARFFDLGYRSAALAQRQPINDQGHDVALYYEVNRASLKLIRDQLDETLDRAVAEFEVYTSHPEGRAAGEASAEALDQVAGTLRLVQLPSAAFLAEEMAAGIRYLLNLESQRQPVLEELGQSFFVLPRYLDYVTRQGQALPILIVDVLNSLRAIRRQPLKPEWEFFDGELPVFAALPATNQVPVDAAAMPRFHHMYQVGLLAVIRGARPGPNLNLMLRALSRFATQYSASGDVVWRLAQGVVSALAHDGLRITFSRKRLLAQIERLMRITIKGEQDDALTASLHKDLGFLICLSSWRDAPVSELLEAAGASSIQPDDSELGRLQSAMNGPGIEAIDTVVKLIREELHGAKDVLEVGAQTGSVGDEDLNNLKQVIQRVVGTLKILNLPGVAEHLKQQLERIRQWQTAQSSGNELFEVADGLLFVEGALGALQRNEMTAQDLLNLDDMARRRVIAGSQLAEAEALVMKESEAGIALVKRAITAYVDSNFDSIHIANVAVSLNTVRGGMFMLGHRRAAAILKSCIAFIEAHTDPRKASDGGQQHQLLETLADALISLEYYLGELQSGQAVDAKILDVAEESLAALGYAVPA